MSGVTRKIIKTTLAPGAIATYRLKLVLKLLNVNLNVFSQ